MGHPVGVGWLGWTTTWEWFGMMMKDTVRDDDGEGIKEMIS
jgi:hypothetical protein